MDFFKNVKQAPPDAILGLTLAFNADPRDMKINLGVGAYKSADLKPLILSAVKEAEKRLFEQETSKGYLPIDGFGEYVEATKQLVFGKSSDRIYGAQTVGGTAALRVGGAFLAMHGFKKIYISDPTWGNHRHIFQESGFEVNTYPYFDTRFNFEGFLDALNQMPPGSLVLMQACCHNPTGCDPTFKQWKQIVECMQTRQLFPFLDFAYQGFGENPEKDAAPIRLFTESDLQCAVAVSHSKNFGLYGERTGALFLVCATPNQAKRVGSRLKTVIRGLYSNPPCHGARIVSTILYDEKLKENWLNELATMAERISQMRKTLVALLEAKCDRFDFLADQVGMFSYTGLTHENVERLTSEYGIYLLKNGRINVAGLNQENVSYVADAIIAVTN